MPSDLSFKPYFLGPKAENESWVRDEFERTLDDGFSERRNLFGDDPTAIAGAEQAAPAFQLERSRIEEALAALVTRLRGALPTYTPRYIGHMSSELALPGLLGHFAALLHNPNNTSKEASRVGALIEAEAIADHVATYGGHVDADRLVLVRCVVMTRSGPSPASAPACCRSWSRSCAA